MLAAGVVAIAASVACEKPALEPGQSWLPMQPETGTLIVRQLRLVPEEKLAEMRIERVGGDPRPDPLTAPMLDEGLKSVGMFVNGAGMLFASWSRMFQAHPNRLPRFDQETSNRVGGLAGAQPRGGLDRLALQVRRDRAVSRRPLKPDEEGRRRGAPGRRGRCWCARRLRRGRPHAVPILAAWTVERKGGRGEARSGALWPAPRRDRPTSLGG
jgi:hypothetical protein